ncbi:MAG: DUF3570 domain-containing protein [Pseudomonadales bacterium]
MAATSRIFSMLSRPFAVSLACTLLAISVQAAVLPEERSDVMYHRYDGGGMVIDGPSVLVRKNFADKVSLAANYYVDNVSSASIDVITIKGASKYSEKRTEISGDVTFLQDDMVFNFGYTDSSENDYEAKSYRFDMSHSFFGDMTTVNAGFSLGDDDISSAEDANFAASLDRRQYRAGIAQVLSKSLIINLNYEGIIDEGYLQNPYRKILVTTLDKPPPGEHPPVPGLYTREAERYPSTRNSDALSLKLAYYLPWQGAIKSRLGYYSDSWGIDGYSVELDYSHKLYERWVLDFRLRHYQQSDADFYANLFYNDTVTQNFAARDKELSEYSSHSVGLGASYENKLNGPFDRYRANIQFEYMYFDYENFREVTPATEGLSGVDNEPLYNFDAYALRVFFTLFY